MHSSSWIQTTGLRALIRTIAAALLLGAALPALAADGETRGKDFLVAKDVNKMTLQLDGVLLQVSDETRILDADKKRISFAAIPDPAQSPSLITWSGTRTGKAGVRASELLVVVPPQ